MKISDSIFICFLLSGFIGPLDIWALKAVPSSLVNTEQIELSESILRAGYLKDDYLTKYDFRSSLI